MTNRLGLFKGRSAVLSKFLTNPPPPISEKHPLPSDQHSAWNFAPKTDKKGLENFIVGWSFTAYSQAASQLSTKPTESQKSTFFRLINIQLRGPSNSAPKTGLEKVGLVKLS